MYLDVKRLGKSPETIRNYTFACRAFEKWVKTPMNEVTEDDIVGYINYLVTDRKLKNSSIETAFVQLSTFFDWMRVKKHIIVNPCDEVEPSKADKRVPIYLTVEETERFFAEADKDPRNKLISRMLYSTGVRVSELNKIKKSDIDFASGEIKVFGKGSKERIVLLHDEYIPLFESYVAAFDKDQVLFPLDKGTIEKNVKEIAKNAGINKKITPHKVRHTFDTHMFKETKDIVRVQELLGHSSISTTQIYTHLDKADLKEGHKKLSAARL
jgi:site-specific recombinase XerD